MMKPRISLFAEQEREDRRSKLGDPLVGLAEHVDFEALGSRIDTAAPRPSRANGGRPPYPTVLMIKILVLQQLYNLADDALEYQLLDRRSFLPFLDLTESSSIPDAKTIWLFRDRLAQAGAGNQVFEEVQQQLLSQGCLALRPDRRRFAGPGTGSAQQAGRSRDGQGRHDAAGLETA
jgi:transposase